MLTQQSENLTVINSENGKTSYRFETPLLERYEFAPEPYMEFRKGVDVKKYDDSTQQVKFTLTANYAIYMETQKLWEAKGNVIATNAEGQKFETEQLFWNQQTKRVYSNVDSKISNPNGDVIIGEGFESDEEFKEYIVRAPVGKVAVDVEPTPADQADANARDAEAARQKAPNPNDPVIREGEAVARPAARPARSSGAQELKKAPSQGE